MDIDIGMVKDRDLDINMDMGMGMGILARRRTRTWIPEALSVDLEYFESMERHYRFYRKCQF
jgi:hypothetical protein